MTFDCFGATDRTVLTKLVAIEVIFIYKITNTLLEAQLSPSPGVGHTHTRERFLNMPQQLPESSIILLGIYQA